MNGVSLNKKIVFTMIGVCVFFALMMGIGVTQVSNLTSILKDKKLVRTSPGGPGGTNLFYPQAPPAGWIRDTEAKITEAKKKTREEKERKWREGI